MTKNISLRYGLFAGVGMVAYILLFYFWDPRLIFMPSVLWSSLLIYLFFMWKGCAKAYQLSTDDYSFQQAIKDAFTIYVFANIVYYVFYYILMKFVDPSLLMVQQEVSLENLEFYAERMDQKQFESMKKALLEGELGIKLNDVLFSFGTSAIGGFFLALITGGIFVKSRE